ncbi:hypothetical protein I5907_17695 [Panacibacter sp. DH6]|uniref:Uncharacterized protein n=1 Tax=Panacibacter microcysteis TaxID=2793269 RepID=A0A931GZ79_9BACT|nr:hypothetical protein [Panacibacter microcysteis]MBG9378076.1 hypothetical protein [Panacibacter microcysteis]
MPGTYKKGEQVNIIYKKDDPESFFINKKRVVLFLTFLSSTAAYWPSGVSSNHTGCWRIIFHLLCLTFIILPNFRSIATCLRRRYATQLASPAYLRRWVILLHKEPTVQACDARNA